MQEQVLRSFFTPEGRLRQLPVKKAKRAVVLARLAAAFEPGRRYAEKEVNDVLRRFHEDFCTLRRELYEAGLLDRAGGFYWRAEPAGSGEQPGAQQAGPVSSRG